MRFLSFFFCVLLLTTGVKSTLRAQTPAQSIKAHYKSVNSLAFTSDGKFLVSGGEEGKVKIWELPSLQNIHELKLHNSLNGILLSGDGVSVVSCSSDQTCNIWNVASGEHTLTFGSQGGIAFYDGAFINGNKQIIVGGGSVLGRRNEIQQYNTETGEMVNHYRLHDNLILSIDLHPDGKRMVSSSAQMDGDGAVILSEIETGTVLRTFASKLGDVRSVVFSNDGEFVAAASDRIITIWETETGKNVFTLNGHHDRVMSVAFTNDGKYVVSGSQDKKVNVWKMADGELATSFENPSSVFSIALSGDNRTIAAGCGDGTINLWSFDPSSIKTEDVTVKSNGLEVMPRVRKAVASPFSNLKEMPELVIETGVHNDLVQNIRYTKDGKEIVTASWDKTIRIWDTANGRLIRTIYVPQYTGIEGQIYAMDVSADKKYIAVAGSSIGQKYDKKTDKYIGDYVLLIDYKSGKIVDVATGHQQSIFSVAFSPDGKKLASCGGIIDNRVNIYNLDQTTNKLSLYDSFVMTVVAQNYFPGCKSVFGDMCEHTVHSVRFSADSKDVYAADAHGMLVRYTMKTPAAEGTYKLIGESAGRKNSAITGKLSDKAVLRSIGVDPKGRYVACGDGAGKVLIVDAKGRDLGAAGATESSEILLATIPTQKKGDVMSLDFDPTGTLLSVAVAGEVRVYEIHMDQLTAPASITTPVIIFKDHIEDVTTATFSNDGTSVVSSGGDYNQVFVWDAKTGKQKFALGGDRKNLKVTRVGVSKSNPLLIGYGNELFQQQRVNHFGQISKAFDIRNLRTVDSAVDSLFSTAESQTREASTPAPEFASMSNESMISYLPLKNGGTVISTFNELFMDDASNLFSITGARSYGMANAPDDETFYIGQSDGKIQIYDTKTLTLIATLYIAGNNEWILFTPDGYYTSSRYGARLVGWLINDGIKNSPTFYPFEQFDLRLNRPDIVLSRIGGLPARRIDLLYKAYQKRLEKMGVSESMLTGDLVAPMVQLNLAVNETTTKMLTFSVKAVDAQNNLDRLNVYINDVPLYGSNGFSLKTNPSKTLDKQIIAELTNGQNKIQVSVLNSAGVESFQETRYVNYRGPIVTPNLYVVAIGVSAYDDQSFNLQYAAKDAKDLSSLYQSQVGKFGSVKVMTILDKEATAEKIKAAKIFMKEARPDDEVVLFVAGHGLLDNNLDFYFATTDVDFNNPSVRGLKYDELEGLLDQVASRKKLMLIDACHSGEIDKDAVVVSDQPVKQSSDANSVKSRGFKNLTNNDLGVTDVYELMRMMFADLRKGSGAMVISSASGVEFAFENDVWKNGVFTYSLLEGLKTGNANLNKDKDVQVSELRDYVIKRVGELTNGKQTPTSRKENLEFDFKVW